MNADERRYLDTLSERVLGAVFEVSNVLGIGFLEKVYERALVRELNARGLKSAVQVSYSVQYKDFIVGEYFADIIVEGALVLELKCVDRLGKEHVAQCLNYLRASGLSVCLLINFARSKVEWQRVVLNF